MADVTNTFYASEAFVGYGTQWLIHQDDGSPGTFVAVAQVANIDFGEMTANIINKTHLRSPGRAHEKKATLRDFGPFTMSGQLNLRHGSHNNAGGDGFTAGGLIALHRNLEERQMQIIIPDGSPETILPFDGVISSLKLMTLGLEEIASYTAQVQPLQDYTADLP